MSAYLSPLGNEVQTDANGAPLVGGLLYWYAAGTSTPATTYTGEDAGTPQANPVVLNASGLPDSPIWLEGGTAHKLIVTDADGVTLRTVDNITGINDPINAGAASEWVIYTGTPTYINATSLSMEGDQTNAFQVGRRLRSTNTGGTVYSTITASAYDVGTALTTVTVANDSGTLDAGLSAVAYGLLSATDRSLPAAITPSTGDNDTSVATTAFVQSSILGGVGQTWANVAASRAVSTTYTNSTGRPIQVAIRVASAVGQAWSLTVQGVAIPSYSANGMDGTIFAVIPPGATYNLTGGTLINAWVELR